MVVMVNKIDNVPIHAYKYTQISLQLFYIQKYWHILKNQKKKYWDHTTRKPIKIQLKKKLEKLFHLKKI